MAAAAAITMKCTRNNQKLMREKNQVEVDNIPLEVPSLVLRLFPPFSPFGSNIFYFRQAAPK